MDDADRVRFIHDLYEFNDEQAAGSTYYSFKNLDIVSPDLHATRKRRKLVALHGWVEMKNHYHLLLSELIEGGMSLFLRKLNVGYAKYFNERYGRTGTLFQGRTKKVLIERQAYFLYILNYVHLNPLDYFDGAEEWRVRSGISIRDADAALAYLKTYRWSSHLDYAGTKNFPSLITKDLFEERLGEYVAELRTYLRDAERFRAELDTLTLE